MSQLDLRIRRPARAIPFADFAKLTSEADAVRYCIDNGGLQDKTIAIEIGVDPAILSKAKQGQGKLNDDATRALQDVTGLPAIAYYHALACGFDPRSMRRLETDVERENRELRERIETMVHEQEIERRAIRELLGPRA